MGNRILGPVLLLGAVMSFSPVVRAQSAEHPGAAKAQKTSIPDLSGVWRAQKSGVYSLDPSDPAGKHPESLPMTPWGEAKFNAVRSTHGARATTQSSEPVVKCFPPGVPRIYVNGPLPMELLQAPGRVIMIFEYDHFVRQIYTDGREHPKDLNPTWMGDAIGHYEGDTLVVDTIGFNDKTWLDWVGHPHSDQLHLIERVHRVNQDTLEDDLTIDDPKAYPKPWNGVSMFTLKPTWRIEEFICVDNVIFTEHQKELTAPAPSSK
jgi:hypothetical protein